MKQQLGKWQWHVLVCTVKGENYIHISYIHICIPGKLYPGITFFSQHPGASHLCGVRFQREPPDGRVYGERVVI